MNADVWPCCLSKRDCQEIRPVADAVAIFAEDLVSHYRAGWDLQTPDVPQIPSGGRKWYLRRETGLRAFARYAAELRLKHFAKDGLLTGADYCEARLQEVLFQWGWREIFNAPVKWEKFVSWRKETTPGFAQKLQVWNSRSNLHALARHSPDSRIKLYALLYDRAPVPLEFCSEAWSVVAVNRVIMREDWPGKRTVSNRESIRRWRRNLELTLSPLVVLTLPHPLHADKLRLLSDDLFVVDHAVAKKVGLPFDFATWRTR